MTLNRRQRVTLIVGVILIFGGLSLVVLQLNGSGSISRWIPLVCGAALLAAAAVIGNAMLFLPAGVLAGAGLGVVLWPFGVAYFLSAFAGGWILVSPLTKIFSDKTLLWPLVPGVATAAVALVLLLAGDHETSTAIIGAILFVTLFIMCAYLLLRRRR